MATLSVMVTYVPDDLRTCIVGKMPFGLSISWNIGQIYLAIWDWTVFGCYIMKVCQFYKKTDNVQQPISIRIKSIVYKMALLTSIMSICSVLASTLYIALMSDKLHWIVMMLVVFTFNLDFTTGVYMVYLMIDHNKTGYVQFIKILDKIGVFCCCKSFVDIAMIMDVEKEKQGKVKKRKVTDVDTRTMGGIPDPLPMVHIERTIESEMKENVQQDHIKPITDDLY